MEGIDGVDMGKGNVKLEPVPTLTTYKRMDGGGIDGFTWTNTIEYFSEEVVEPVEVVEEVWMRVKKKVFWVLPLLESCWCGEDGEWWARDRKSYDKPPVSVCEKDAGGMVRIGEDGVEIDDV